MREIVGVVGDAKQAVLGTDPDPIYYFPYKQLPWGIGTIVLRTAVPPLEVESRPRARRWRTWIGRCRCARFAPAKGSRPR